MDQLVAMLFENLIIDFQANISLETVRALLKPDESKEAKALLSKLVEERGVSDMLICMADCLKEQIANGIKPDDIRDQLCTYSES